MSSLSFSDFFVGLCHTQCALQLQCLQACMHNLAMPIVLLHSSRDLAGGMQLQYC